MKLLECGTVIDGEVNTPVEDGRILIEDEIISEVGPAESISAPTEAEQIDFSDKTVIPGLIDAHLHLTGSRSMDPIKWTTESETLGAARATADLRNLLRAGFTSVRDVGSKTGLGLRDAVAENEIPGPRIFTSGQAISQTAGHGDSHMLPHDWVKDGQGISALADGEDECRKEARKRIRDGVDLLKIMTTGGVLSEKDAPDQSQFTDAEIKAFTEEAHRVGIPVASHAQGAPGIKSAIRNGVDTIEHGFYLDEEALDLMKEHETTFVPTLSIMHQLVTHGDEHGVPEYGLKKAREARKAHFDAVERAYSADIPIALGTDFIGPELVPHGDNALEAELFVTEVGMDEMDAIKSGTSVAARTVPADDIGYLRPEYKADITVIDGDPLADITNLYNVEAVFKNGVRTNP
ncbi:MAG: amidohydrolase family protein [Halobacteriaceae archaeon]